jgi:hypothetical protein
MASPKHDIQPTTFHPTFSSPCGDIVLRCRDTFYRIPSYVLRRTTKLLQEDWKTSNNGVAAGGSYIHMVLDEDEKAVERVLRLISGLETPRCESFDELERSMFLAEKWGAPGPLSVLRYAITAPMCLDDPIRLYGLACRYDWRPEARIASRCTLTFDLFDEENQEALQQVSSRDLLLLLHFHRLRRDRFKEMLDTGEAFEAGNSKERFCKACGITVSNHTWRELKWRMLSEMDRRPAGDTLLSLDMEEWPEAVACWEAKCKTESCNAHSYDKLGTLKAIKDCLEQLPDCI